MKLVHHEWVIDRVSVPMRRIWVLKSKPLLLWSKECWVGMNCRKEDKLVQESLHARRTRLLAFLSFLYPISVNRSNEYMIRGIVLPEQVLRSSLHVLYWVVATGVLHDSKWNEVNAALGFLSHIVLLLSKYFNVRNDDVVWNVDASLILYRLQGLLLFYIQSSTRASCSSSSLLGSSEYEGCEYSLRNCILERKCSECLFFLQVWCLDFECWRTWIRGWWRYAKWNW